MDDSPRKPLPESITIRHEAALGTTERKSTLAFLKQLTKRGAENLRQLFAETHHLKLLGIQGLVAFDHVKNKPVGAGFSAPAEIILSSNSSFSKALKQTTKKPLQERGVDAEKLAYFMHLLVDPAYRGQNVGSHLFAQHMELAKNNGFTHALAVIEDGNDESRRIFGRGLEPIATFIFEGKTLHAYLREISR